MDFTEAISYSLKTHNIPKILTIVLVSMIVGVSVFVVGIALESWAIWFVIVPVILAYYLFVQGYTISVIKSVMDEDDVMPSFDVGRDIGRGAIILIANLVYAIPVIAFWACGSFMIVNFASGMSDVSLNPNEAIMTVFAMFCVMGLLSLVVMFVVNFSLVVGKVRYAAEDRPGALFDFGKNFSTVMSNLGPSMGLFARVIGIGIIFYIFTVAVLNVIGSFFSGISNQMLIEMEVGNFDAIAKLGMPFAIFLSLYYTTWLVFDLMKTFSSAHLFAGYGAELGLAPNRIVEGRSNSTAIVLAILAIFVLFVLVATVTIVILVLLGPTISQVFSTVIEGA